ncbi:MAG: HAD family hydrolase [Myxococcota bacterium]
MSIPYAELRAVFIDAGNTLFAMDYALMSETLEELGVHLAPGVLQRAEAAARPAVSSRVAAGRSTESSELFRFYMQELLSHALGEAHELPDGLLERWVARLQAPDARARLWTRVPRGTREWLRTLRAAQLRLAVVSNSDGTIEDALRRTNLREYVDHVVDSGTVGFEKPDPRIFRHALERVRVEPGEALHVGDLYAVDVLGARAAGVHALLLDPHGDWRGVECEVAQDLEEVTHRILSVRAQART